MSAQTISDKYRLKVIIAILAVLSNLKSVFADYSQDISYAIVTSARHIKGDNLIANMWEPHQLSAFVADMLMFPFYKITGSWDFVAIYMQFAGLAIFTVTAVLLYKILQKHCGTNEAFYAALLFYICHPKDVVFPEFSNLLIIFVIFAVICIWLYYEKSGNRFLHFVSSVFMSMAVLAYPMSVILYPALIIYIFIKSGNGDLRKGRVGDALSFSLPA